MNSPAFKFLVTIAGCLLLGLSSVCAQDLGYYHDSFDTLRPDIWETSIYVHKKVHEQNIAAGDVYAQDGKLIMRTQTGKYSKGTIRSLFKLEGDFDIQLDMKIDFDEQSKTPQHVMFWLNVAETNHDALVLMFKPGKSRKVVLLLLAGKDNKEKPVKEKRFSSFDGTIRWVRTGARMTCYMRENGKSGWDRVGSFSYSKGPVQVGVNVRNYHRHESQPAHATESVLLFIDNFRINAADGLAESDI